MHLSASMLQPQLEPLFRENFEKFGELGAALSIWQNGKEILHLCGGHRDARREKPWDEKTIVLVWSATKGIGSASLLHVLQENKLALTRRVSEFWPEFRQNGKSEITIAQLLSHAAGLCAFSPPADVLDYRAVITALEQQAPLWPPGTAHGYHARTFGFLIDELVRRITELTISEYWRKFLAEPLGLDFWVGLPRELNNRVATIYAARAGSHPPEPIQFYRDLTTTGTLQQRTFTSPHGLYAISAMNNPEVRAHPIVSFGGIGSARALGKFYAMLANDGIMEDRRYFASTTIGWMTDILSSGKDLIFEIPTAFSAGFMRDPPDAPRCYFGRSGTGFGHPGAGGSHAFADPKDKISFAYVMNQMEQTVLPNEKSLRLVEAVYG